MCSDFRRAESGTEVRPMEQREGAHHSGRSRCGAQGHREAAGQPPVNLSAMASCATGAGEGRPTS